MTMNEYVIAFRSSIERNCCSI